jgi:hypothetical protein
MVSVVLHPDNQNETKHVESKLFPRLDEGSNPSRSTNLQTLLRTLSAKSVCFFTLTYHLPDFVSGTIASSHCFTSMFQIPQARSSSTNAATQSYNVSM